MRVSFQNNTLVVVTSIKEETVKKGIADLKVTDDKKNELYSVRMTQGTDGAVSKFGLTCNAFIDGKAAVVIVQPVGTTIEDVQKKYGEALIEARVHTEAIALAAESKEEAIAAIFETVAE